MFAGAGDEHDDPNAPNGDFIVTIKVDEHPFFRRVVNDVHTELSVTMTQGGFALVF